MKNFIGLILALFLPMIAVSGFYPINRGSVNQATVVTKATGTTTIASTANQVYFFEGAASQNVKLPNAQNLPLDWWYEFTNTTTGPVSVLNNAGTQIGSIAASRNSKYVLKDRSTTNGTWYQSNSVGSLDLDHGLLLGLGDDDHSQYHNDTRGDARYYKKTEHINATTGVSDAAKPVITGASGLIDASLIPAGAGSGDVNGPVSSTDNALVRFDSTTGKVIQNSVAILSDIGDLSGLGEIQSTSFESTYNTNYSGQQAWVKGDSAMVRIGSSTFDGDPTDEESYAFIAYGTNVSSDPMSSTNYGLGFYSPKSIQLYTEDTTPGQLTGNFFAIDSSNLTYTADTGNIFNVDRATGIIDTNYAAGVCTFDASGTVASTSASSDFLTQYFLLAGRSGGQTANGGTAASNNLILDSTANATKGNITLGDVLKTFTNTSVGVFNGTKTTTPLGTMHLKGSVPLVLEANSSAFAAGDAYRFQPSSNNLQLGIITGASNDTPFYFGSNGKFTLGYANETYKQNIGVFSFTGTDPLGAITSAPILNFQNYGAANNTVCGGVTNSNASNKISSGIFGICENQTTSQTGHLEFVTYNAGTGQIAAEIDPDMDAHFNADVEATSLIKTYEGFVMEDPGAGTGVVSMEAVAGTSTMRLKFPGTVPSANQVLTATAVSGSDVTLGFSSPSSAGMLASAKKTANYALTNSDDIVYCNASSGDITITLHSAATATLKPYRIKNINTKSCWISPASGEYLGGIQNTSMELIPGATSLDGPALDLIPDGGSLWSIF